MRIEIRNDSVILDGYVNAVGRDSKPIITADGRCVEQIEPRAFQQALDRADNIKLLLNHDTSKHFASTKEKNLELYEDNIGLRAISTVTDPDIIKKARENKLRGWSFGMYVNKSNIEERADNIPRRHVEDLDLFEVSIIDDRQSPCYAGTLIEHRSDGGETISEKRSEEFRAVIIENKPEKESVDYTKYENKIKNLKEKK